MKKIILSLIIAVVLIPSAAAFADEASDQLTAMLQAKADILQAKMEEVAQLKAENDTLREQLEQCRLSQASAVGTTTGSEYSSCVNQAEFMEDITIPDGTKLSPGESFTKTWQLRNTGTCTWTTGYKVVSIGKFRMGGEQSAYLPHEVKPGDTVDISLRLSAPLYIGDYESEYRLQDEQGNLFGIIGTLSKKELSFWLKIDVVDKSECALVSMSPASVSRGSEFDAVFTIKNNSGETWNAKTIDVKMTDGKDFLKRDNRISQIPAASYIDLPKNVDPGDSITLIYDMIASDEGGNHELTLEFIRDGGVYCTVYGNINFK